MFRRRKTIKRLEASLEQAKAYGDDLAVRLCKVQTERFKLAGEVAKLTAKVQDLEQLLEERDKSVERNIKLSDELSVRAGLARAALDGQLECPAKTPWDLGKWLHKKEVG